MQCKHSAIIYDTEIKYCKSPSKPDNTPNVYFEKDKTLRKVASSSYFVSKGNNGKNELNPVNTSIKSTANQETK